MRTTNKDSLYKISFNYINLLYMTCLRKNKISIKLKRQRIDKHTLKVAVSVNILRNIYPLFFPR